LAKQKKIRPQIFPAAQILTGPLLSYAAEISAPWQHWKEGKVERIIRENNWILTETLTPSPVQCDGTAGNWTCNDTAGNKNGNGSGYGTAGN
jgi:hypothetical protein